MTVDFSNWAAAVGAQVDGDAVGIAGFRLEPGNWRAALSGLHDLGHVRLELLAGVDRESHDEVYAVLTDGLGTQVMVCTTAPPEGLASIVPIFPGAQWHEQEAHEMVGIVFRDDQGHEVSNEPLLLRPDHPRFPLRRAAEKASESS
ncbi:MAG TPA: hypothetical protein DCM51_03490 [Actinobacteria bacterium]|nr:hypothetical protein [Actinomycetota bacterium]